jgi:hypothetical protein
MKRFLLALPVVVLLAAGCNSSPQVSSQTPVQNPVAQSTTPTPATPTASPVQTSNLLVIKEWGVEFQKPTGMSDLEYVIDASPGSNGNTADFITQQLVDLDKSTGGKYCVAGQAPIGVLSRVQNFNANQQDGHYIPTNVKMGDWYYFFTPPQASCSDNKQVQALETKEILGGAVLQTLQAVPTVTPTTSQTPQPVSSLDYTSTEDSSNWKMYKNTTYGFQFKYPPQWIVATGKVDTGVNRMDPNVLFAMTVTDDTDQFNWFGVTIDSNPQRQTLAQWQAVGGYDDPSDELNKTQVTINGTPGLKMMGFYVNPTTPSTPYETTNVLLFLHQNQEVTFNFETDPGIQILSKMQELQTELNTIYSTVVFSK